MPEKVLLLVNTGTPDTPDKDSVKKYLSEFLNDPYVIDLPWLFRKILVNLIIVPFRASTSSGLYNRLWTKEGSPLKIHLDNLVSKLRLKLRGRYRVIGAMRYGNPSIRSALKGIKEDSEITILPLYPQYASATTGSVKKAVMNELKALKKTSGVIFIEQFCSEPSFIDAFAERIRSYGVHQYEHILFSYHSLPVRQIMKVHPGIRPDSCECTEEMPGHGTGCYKAMCYLTTRLLAEKLGLEEGFFTTTFQSAMSGKWIGPFTNETVKDMALAGKKKILVAAPSFVADCLETIIEIRDEYRNIFLSYGGKELVLVDSLNDCDDWVNSINIILDTPIYHSGY